MDNNQTKSVLPTLRDHHVVVVHNPLLKDYTWQIARTVVQLEQDKIDPYINAAGLRNESHPTNKHVTQKITIPSGKTLKLPGSVAQVYVKHLVDEMMMMAGHKSTLTDPELRSKFETQVILNIDDLKSTLSTTSIEEQLNSQIDELNREEVKQDEQEFAEFVSKQAGDTAVEETTATNSGFGESETVTPKRGRPARR